MTTAAKRPIKLVLAAPRGICAGIVRAIDFVEKARERYGKPAYVRHEIVHNRYLAEDFNKKGAILIEEVDELPDGDHPVIFSAHGVPKALPQEPRARQLFFLNATFPLVSKVHMESVLQLKTGYEIVLIGHSG